jgi:hypothetical protein
MKPKDLLRLPKVVTKAGEWKVITGRSQMPSSAFPLSKSYAVKLGRNWHWRVDAVQACEVDYRVLTAFNLEIEEYRAWLSMAFGDAYVIVAQLEFHGTHPGWHSHIACCDIDDVEPGRGHPRAARRFPNGNNRHRRQAFDVTESSALSAAFNFFRVTGTPGGSML